MHKEKLSWHTEKRKVSDLIPWEQNPRQMTEKQVADLKKSLEKFNLMSIPVVDLDNRIVSGHQRMQILHLLGRAGEEIDVRVPNRKLSTKEFEEANIRENKNLGEWNWDTLVNNYDLDELIDWGWTKEELSSKFTPRIVEDDFDAQAEYDAIKEVKTKRGDLYLMGPHRLLCGDCTERADVEFLMNGDKADMVFTDPPYGVDYSYQKYDAIHKKRKDPFADSGKILGDNQTSAQLYQFLLDSFVLINELTKESAAFYCCFATRTELEFRTAFRDAGFHFSQTIIWLKERIVLSMGQDYHRVYEPILFGWKEGSKHYKDKTITREKEVWDPDKMTFEERLDVWWISRDKSQDYIHPTQKPIRLVERAMNKNSKIGDLLYEPFNGSGSTMMACEQGSRRCYACELDPKYCDVAVLRWERVTGKKAERIQKC